VKDFDISMEAGGVDRALKKTFNVTVSENHLEIHLFWAGKGTCCNPIQGYYGPSISALNVVPGNCLNLLIKLSMFRLCFSGSHCYC
jgi:hypothetical protein